MKEIKTVSMLAKGVVNEMERLNYAPFTIREFRYNCNNVKRYAINKFGIEVFTKKLGEEYLKDKIGYPFETHRRLNAVESTAVRCIRDSLNTQN
jgi:hypothetical protein